MPRRILTALAAAGAAVVTLAVTAGGAAHGTPNGTPDGATLRATDGATPKDTYGPADGAAGRTAPGSGPADRAGAVPQAGPYYLVFTVRDSGDPAADGTYGLRCHRAGGGHPRPRAACDALDAATAGGANPFAPVPPGAPCAMIHGGPAVAHITGVWEGKPVVARFDRVNGCEISRWNALVPALPAVT